MASGTLYGLPGNFRTSKILVAAQYSGAHVKLATDFVFGETNKSDEFLKKFPFGKVPAFESNDGKCLVESNAIAYYVANEQLRGDSHLQQSEVIQWLDFADGVILPVSCKLVYPLIGIMPLNKQTADAAKEELNSTLQFLNNYLLTRTYLVGERITLADIVMGLTMTDLYSHVLDKTLRQPFAHVNRWFSTIVNQPQVKSVIGEFKLCENATPFDPKKYAYFQGKTAASKEKKEAKKPQPQQPKKESPKKEDPEEDMDLADEALAAEPKSKDPFDFMPKGTFNMEDFKRFYSNNDEADSIPYFWEKFDKENYSIWFGEYKYNHELDKVFMSCNLITGMFQRLDKMRKQAFASVCLFGSDKDSSISGLWVWRGHDLAFELSPDWKTDYDVYAWKKLDPDSEETKELVKQYFSWTGTDKQGRKFNQGKIFK